MEEYKEKFLQLQQEMTKKVQEKDTQLEALKKEKELLELRLKVMADEVESCKKQTKSLQDDCICFQRVLCLFVAPLSATCMNVVTEFNLIIYYMFW